MQNRLMIAKWQGCSISRWALSVALGVCLLGWTGLAVAAAPAVAGKGFFFTPKGNNWDFDKWSTAVKANADVTGYQYQYVWSDIQPLGRHQFDWSRIEFGMHQAELSNKQFAFKFFTVSGEAKSNDANGKVYQNNSTPAWFFNEAGVQIVGNIADTGDPHHYKLPKYPVFWDPVYLSCMEELIKAMAEKYDGNPRLEYIRIGGWSCETNEPNGYGDTAKLGFISSQLTALGLPGTSGVDPDNLPGDSVLSQASITMQNLWMKYFKKTRLAGVIHTPKRSASWCEVFNANLVANHAMMMNTGLNEGDHTTLRTQFRTWHDTNACPVGWAGITNLGSKGGAHTGKTLRESATWEGIGDDSTGSDYKPASRVSYMVSGDDWVDSPSGSTEPECTLGWANDHFVAFPPPHENAVSHWREY